jgi:hypothetical protein
MLSESHPLLHSRFQALRGARQVVSNLANITKSSASRVQSQMYFVNRGMLVYSLDTLALLTLRDERHDACLGIASNITFPNSLEDMWTKQVFIACLVNSIQCHLEGKCLEAETLGRSNGTLDVETIMGTIRPYTFLRKSLQNVHLAMTA